jgi:hypothetical protein
LCCPTLATTKTRKDGARGFIGGALTYKGLRARGRFRSGGIAYETGAGASNYQTNPHPGRYSETSADRDRLEKLSIVRTLPNAPDFYLRLFAVGSVGCPSCRFPGQARAGPRESVSDRSHRLPPAEGPDKLHGQIAYKFPEDGQAHDAAKDDARQGASRCVHT